MNDEDVSEAERDFEGDCGKHASLRGSGLDRYYGSI